MARFKVEAYLESDRDEEQLGMFIEGLMAGAGWHFKLLDGLAVYEVTS
ncbi:hypothetical protein MINTMi198_17800 [Mycobacterium intracellulare M.i.198]|nr:hypothetical protein [Mycobacterium intracellulare]BCP36410.1 hypothetical protein MINTMi198_17800 [Mycobacterium intracellulare M.i.198]